MQQRQRHTSWRGPRSSCSSFTPARAASSARARPAAAPRSQAGCPHSQLSHPRRSCSASSIGAIAARRRAFSARSVRSSRQATHQLTQSPVSVVTCSLARSLTFSARASSRCFSADIARPMTSFRSADRRTVQASASSRSPVTAASWARNSPMHTSASAASPFSRHRTSSCACRAADATGTAPPGRATPPPHQPAVPPGRPGSCVTPQRHQHRRILVALRRLTFAIRCEDRKPRAFG
jgi:hypothetical protein